MFGYVRAYKPELRVREFEAYRGVYCTLCRVQGRRFGPMSRFLLSYDVAFLAMLNACVSGACTGFYNKRCVFNPLKKCKYCKDERAFDLAADAAMILSYYNLLDNIADSRGVKRLVYRAAKPWLARKYKKAAASSPRIDGIVTDYWKAQQEAEKAGKGLDAAAEPTAVALGGIFALCDEEQSRPLYRMGYCLGKWIYLIDAGADLADDIKKNRFNPLKSDRDGYKERLEANLNVCAAECADAFALVKGEPFRKIIENVIYLGLKNSKDHVFQKEK